MPPDVDVKKIRRKQRLTQVEFASRYGLNVARVRDWEQHRPHPDSAARAYLTVIAREPEAVKSGLGD